MRGRLQFILYLLAYGLLVGACFKILGGSDTWGATAFAISMTVYVGASYWWRDRRGKAPAPLAHSLQGASRSSGAVVVAGVAGLAAGQLAAPARRLVLTSASTVLFVLL